MIVEFTFYANRAAFVGIDRQCYVEAGDIELMLGNSSDGLKLAGNVRIKDARVIENGLRNYTASYRVG